MRAEIAEIAEIAEALAPCRECRSDLFRAKPQRHEDVVLAAKRLFPFTLRQIATMEGKVACRPRASFLVAFWLCGFERNQHFKPVGSQRRSRSAHTTCTFLRTHPQF